MVTNSKKSNVQNTIKIGNKLVIGTINEIHENLLNSFKTQKKITLQSDLLETIDLTGIQLLIWAKKKAEKHNIELKSEIKFSESALDMAEKAGFLSYI